MLFVDYNLGMKGTGNLSKKGSIPASIPRENQSRISTKMSTEGIFCMKVVLKFCLVFVVLKVYYIEMEFVLEIVLKL